MSEIIIFAGTTEGRELAEFLSRQKTASTVCTATEYGGQIIGNDAYRTVRAGRLDVRQMCALLEEKGGDADQIVVDATHPYAREVTANIREACSLCGAQYIRLLRAGSPAETGAVTVASVQEAVDFLAGTTGNILVTTGSKELEKFTALPDFQERVYARVLSTPEAVQASARLGFAGKHLICMQGPFDEELNTAMLRQFRARWLVTKESGAAGGFTEKIAAAQKAGAGIVLIGRPVQESGMAPSAVRAHLIRACGIKVKRRIAIVGTGMGPGTMTEDALRVCRSAELLIGAQRMLDMFADAPGDRYASYRPEEIRAYLEEHPEYESVALLQSGDVGFYSGAKRLYPLFAGEDVAVYPGVSSLAALCARLRVSWEDARLVSLHGRRANVIAAVRESRKVFALAGKGADVRGLLEKLIAYGMDGLTVTVGENLFYPGERICAGTARELLGEDFADLCVVWIENPGAHPCVTHGIDDGEFLRGDVPMTKSEVRIVSLSKLRLQRDSVVYDVGAGTGSVAVEAALLASDGFVYAIEKKEEAAELIEANRRKFAADNLAVVRGTAPEAMKDLPAPTHVFVGGSSGNLRRILEAVLEKNPLVRIVVNCIALETAAEALDCIRSLPLADVDIISVSVGKAKEIGKYHMMMGQNPVTVISCSGGKAV